MKKLILSMILLTSFSIVQALEFKSFNFNDESDCAEQLGQQPVSLPYDIINVNHLSKSKEICLQAYTGDNACRKEYQRQKDALGLISGIRSNHTAEQEVKSKKQCGGWLKGRRNACESFLQQASQVCYQLNNLLGVWSGGYQLHTTVNGKVRHIYIDINITHKISNTKFSGTMTRKMPGGCSDKSEINIEIDENIAHLQKTYLSVSCNKNKHWIGKTKKQEYRIDSGTMIHSPSACSSCIVYSGDTVLRKQ